jgi:hypothetical protein
VSSALHAVCFLLVTFLPYSYWVNSEMSVNFTGLHNITSQKTPLSLLTSLTSLSVLSISLLSYVSAGLVSLLTVAVTVLVFVSHPLKSSCRLNREHLQSFSFLNSDPTAASGLVTAEDRCLATDIRSDSDIHAFRLHATVFWFWFQTFHTPV